MSFFVLFGRLWGCCCSSAVLALQVLSFGCRLGALSGWSLVNSVCGMEMFFRFGSPGVRRSDPLSGVLQL